MWECPCVAFVDLIFFSFFFFGGRTVLGFDACHLFPQHMLAISPLIVGVQLCGCMTCALSQEGTWLPVMGALVVVVSHACFKEGGGSDLHQLTGPLEVVVAPVCACLWSLRWQHQLIPTPGAHAGSTLPPQSIQRKKLLWGPAPQLECLQQCHLKRAYFFYFKIFYLSICFWLCWVFITAHRLSLVVSRG